MADLGRRPGVATAAEVDPQGPGDLRPAVFLDRDGTVVVEREYLADPDDVRLVPGVPEALRDLREAGFALVVVTNQSGIARSYYTEADYHAVAGRVNDLLREAGAPVDATYYCPHHPDRTGPCDCRKPGTGMYLRAARELGLDPAASYYVGDRLKDVLPAGALGGTGVLVRTGYGREEEGRAPPGVRVVDDLPAAARAILELEGRGSGPGDHGADRPDAQRRRPPSGPAVG